MYRDAVVRIICSTGDMKTVVKSFRVNLRYVYVSLNFMNFLM
jgi:hypothetical protein